MQAVREHHQIKAADASVLVLRQPHRIDSGFLQVGDHCTSQKADEVLHTVIKRG